MLFIIIARYRVSSLLDKVEHYEEMLARLAEKEAHLTGERQSPCHRNCGVCNPHDVVERLRFIATDARRARARIDRASRELALWRRYVSLPADA